MVAQNTSFPSSNTPAAIDVGDRIFKAPDGSWSYEKSTLVSRGIAAGDIVEHDTRKPVCEVARQIRLALSADPELAEFAFEWFEAAARVENAPWPTSDVDLFANVERGSSEGWSVKVYVVRERRRDGTSVIELLLHGKTFQPEYAWAVAGKISTMLGLTR